MANKLKIFIDSNIWFSAFYKKGLISQLIESLFEKQFEVVISQLVLEEVIRNIEKKLSSALPLVYQFFQEYPVTIIKNPSLKQIKKFRNLADKKDLPILISAINYKCVLFITGNIKDFNCQKIKEKYYLKILTPKQAKITLNSKNNPDALF